MSTFWTTLLTFVLDINAGAIVTATIYATQDSEDEEDEDERQ